MEHLTDHDLERYHLGMVTEEPELTAIEEHLLWCHDCLDRAEKSDQYVDAMRAGAIRGGFDVDVLAEEYRPKG
jgi:hypothetical protein